MMTNRKIKQLSEAMSFIDQLSNGYWPLHVAMYYQHKEYEKQISDLTTDLKKSNHVISEEFNAFLKSGQLVLLEQYRKRLENHLSRINLYDRPTLVKEFVQLVDDEYQKKNKPSSTREEKKRKNESETGMHLIAKSIYSGSINNELTNLKEIILQFETKTQNQNLTVRERIEKKITPTFALSLTMKTTTTTIGDHTEIHNERGTLNNNNFDKYIDKFAEQRLQLYTNQKRANNYEDLYHIEKDYFNNAIDLFPFEQKRTFQKYLTHLTTLINATKQNEQDKIIQELETNFQNQYKAVVTKLHENKGYAILNVESIIYSIENKIDIYEEKQLLNQSDYSKVIKWLSIKLRSFKRQQEEQDKFELKAEEKNKEVIQAGQTNSIKMLQNAILEIKNDSKKIEYCKKTIIDFKQSTLRGLDLTPFIEFLSLEIERIGNNKTSTHLKKITSKKFDDLFKTPELMEQCIQVLKDTEPRIFTDENLIIRNKKGAIVMWFDIMREKGLIQNQSDKIYTDLFSAKFESIDNSTFRKTDFKSKINKPIYTDLEKLLSQLSPIGNLGKLN